MADLTAVADELYALTPDRFTATRNQRAREASTSGDKSLAEEIRALPKPSVAAWTVNMLVREQPELVEEVLALGAELRTAQSNLNRDALTRLSQQRRQLVTALGKQATDLARRLGAAISAATVDDVEQTLQAAMADPRAATAVRTGRLTRALDAIGLDPVDLTDAVAVPGESVLEAAPPEAAPDAAAGERRLREARRQAEEAQQRAEEADADRAHLERGAAAAARRRAYLGDELDRLSVQLATIREELERADLDHQRLERERDRAAQAAKAARAEAERARERLEKLS